MKENSKFFFVRSANKAFRQGRYLEAQAFYEKAAETLGAKIVAFNIKLCQIRIGSTTESGTKYIPSKINQKIVETKTIEPKEPLDHLIATKRPIWTSARMPSTNAAVVKGIVSINGNYEKAGVILIKLFDNENHELSSHKISLGKSEVFGASFKYLSDTSGVYLEIARVSADLEFSRIETAICLFNAPAGCNIEIKHFTIERPYSTPLNIREIGESGEYKSPEEYKVAMIADEFTHNSFQSEFYSFPITPDNWKEVFEKKNQNYFCVSLHGLEWIPSIARGKARFMQA